MTYPEWTILIFVSYLFLQDDIDPILERIYLEALLLWFNGNLLVRSYLIYRKLKEDMEGNGLPIPPFSFKPIQKRS